MEHNSININNDSEFEIQSTLYSFIGLQFEKICNKYLNFVFPKCTILIQKRIYFGNSEEKNYIIPDVCISNISKEMASRLHIHQNSKIIVDFKRSLTAIGQKDLNYLNIVPDSTLIFCLLHNEAKRNKKSKIKSIFDPSMTEDNKNKVLNKITIWSAKNEFTDLMPEKEKRKFFEEINELDDLHDIKKVNKINSDIISNITRWNDPLVQQCIKNLNETFDSLQQMKYLVILQEAMKLKHFTKEDLLSIVNYSQSILEEVLNFLVDRNVIQKKIFSVVLTHFYYYHQQPPPNFIDYFKYTDQIESVIGLNLLIKSGKIPFNVIEDANFDSFRTNFDFDNRYSISSMFKICSLFENEIVVTPEEVTSILGINQNNTAELLRLLQSMGFLQRHNIEWETSIKCYTFNTYKSLPLKFKKKYLPKLINLSLDQITTNTNLKIIEVNDLKKIFGANWYSKLQIYGVFVKYKELYPNGYDPETIIELLRKENLNHAFEKVRKLVAILATEKINLLAIERKNSGIVGKIKRYIVKDQNNPLYQKQCELASVKERQIESGIKMINKMTQLIKQDIKANLKDGWTTKVRIIYILKTQLKTNERTITVEKAMSLLEKNKIRLSRTNFIRYLTPFSRQPFNLISVVRIKRGENSPIQTIRI